MHRQGAAARVIFFTEKSRFREDGFFPLDGTNLDVPDPQPSLKELISRQLVAAETRSAESPGRWLSRATRNETQSLEIP